MVNTHLHMVVVHSISPQQHLGFEITQHCLNLILVLFYYGYIPPQQLQVHLSIKPIKGAAIFTL